MAFENETQEEILKRMLQKVDDGIDKREGSIVHDMLSPASIEFALAYIELNNILNFGFADTTYGEYLDRRVREVGLTRKSALKATGKLTFTGPVNTVIPANTIISTSDELNPIYFQTLEELIIMSERPYKVNAEATAGGLDGNVNVGFITELPADLQGVGITVTNELSFEGGSDIESDENLLVRYYDRMQNKAAAGSINEYRTWALEAHTNVSDARVFEKWDGPGTVKVVLLATNRRPPSQSVVDIVYNYIEEKRPIGSEVTVIGAKEVPVDIRVTLTLKEDGVLGDAITQIGNNVTTYLKSLAFNDTIIRYTKIAECILNATDVLDYENLSVNLGTSNIQIASDEVAVFGKVFNI